MAPRKGWKSPRRIEVDDTQLLDLYVRQRMPYKEVATLMGCGAGVVQRRLRELNVMRTPGETMRGRYRDNYLHRRIDKQGYVAIKLPADSPFWPMTGTHGYVREHRLIMAQYLGRCLERWEVVHHKNHNRQDNRIENLKLFRERVQHDSETVTHTQMLKLRRENERLKRRIAELEQELEHYKPRLLEARAAYAVIQAASVK